MSSQDPKTLKMYICLLDDVPLGYAMTATAHAGLIAHKAWKNDPVYQQWLTNSFKKVVCKVSAATWQDLILTYWPTDTRALPYNLQLISESRLGNRLTGLIILPSYNPPKILRTLKLYQ